MLKYILENSFGKEEIIKFNENNEESLNLELEKLKKEKHKLKKEKLKLIINDKKLSNMFDILLLEEDKYNKKIINNIKNNNNMYKKLNDFKMKLLKVREEESDGDILFYI